MTEIRREMKNQMEENNKNLRQQISETNEKWNWTSQELQQVKSTYKYVM